MDMKQYPAKRRNRKHQTKISGDKTMNVQNTNDEVQNILSKTDEEKQALMEYAGFVAAFETEVKRVLGKEAPETADEAMLMCTDAKCKEAMDNLNQAYFTFVEKFGYSPEFACTVQDVIPTVRELAALSVKGLFKQPETEVNMTEAKEAVTTATEVVKETVEEVAEATNEAVEKAADAVTDTVDSAKVVAIEVIEEAEDAMEAVKAETGEEVSIDLVIEEAPKKRELSEEEKAQIKADAEAKAKADVERLTEEARRSQNPLTAAWDFIKSPFSKA